MSKGFKAVLAIRDYKVFRVFKVCKDLVRRELRVYKDLVRRELRVYKEHRVLVRKVSKELADLQEVLVHKVSKVSKEQVVKAYKGFKGLADL